MKHHALLRLPQNSTLMEHALITTSVENWLGQPVLPWNYRPGPEKAVAGLVTTEFYFDGKTC